MAWNGIDDPRRGLAQSPDSSLAYHQQNYQPPSRYASYTKSSHRPSNTSHYPTSRPDSPRNWSYTESTPLKNIPGPGRTLGTAKKKPSSEGAKKSPRLGHPSQPITQAPAPPPPPPPPQSSPTPIEYIPVYLNVYKLDLSLPLNAYHSAVEVAGQEYAYAGNIGVYVCMPGGGRAGNGMALKERRHMGYVKARPSDVHRYMKALAASKMYAAKNYDVLARNCNHFAEDCIRGLDVEKKPPHYVNALARSGQRLRCLVPQKYLGEDPSRQNGSRRIGWREAFCSC